MAVNSGEVPALVLGRGVTALGTLRSLGRHRVPVFSLSRDDPMLRWSRHYQTVSGSPPCTALAKELPSVLRALPFDRAVLFPCSDHLSMAAAELPEDLAPRFPFVHPDRETLLRLTDKENLAGALSDAGVPHPTTISLHSGEDLEAIAPALLRTGFLKPTDSQSFFRRFEQKAFSIESLQQGISSLQQALRCGLGMMFQEYIPGPASYHYFVDGVVCHDGEIPVCFSRRRIRMYPPDFGNSSYMISISPTEVKPAIENLKRLLGSVRYRGIFSAEFKFDPRDRLFKLLEVNTRPWWYIGFADSCAAPIAFMAYQDALGEPVGPLESYRQDVPMVYPYYDFFACRTMLREGRLSWWSWAKSWMRAKRAVFQWRDPLPAMATGFNTIRRFMRHHVGNR